MSVLTYTKTGTKATEAAKLDKAIFSLAVTNHDLLKEAYLSHQANQRSAGAKTKKRGEVRGGGIKPWRQKGTGRARVGSIRSPIWRGGGITFGPTGNQNYTHKLTGVSKRQAVKQALSLSNAAGKIVVLEAFSSPEGKTSGVVKLFKKLDLSGNSLLVVETKEQLTQRATRNIPSVKVVTASYLSAFDILNADNVVLTKDSLAVIGSWLNPKPTKAEKS